MIRPGRVVTALHTGVSQVPGSEKFKAFDEVCAHVVGDFMFWSGTIIALSGLVLGVTLGDGVTAFVNVPSLVFVGMIGCGVVIAAHGPGIVGVLLRAIRGRACGDERECARLAAVTGRQSFLAAGWIGLIIGVVQMLGALDDPAQLGGGMATALLTVLYACLAAYMFWLPLERRLTTAPIGTRPATSSL